MPTQAVIAGSDPEPLISQRRWQANYSVPPHLTTFTSATLHVRARQVHNMYSLISTGVATHTHTYTPVGLAVC